MQETLLNALASIIQTVFGLYLLIVLLRALFQIARIDYYNPFVRFVVTLTEPPLSFLRCFIPSYKQIDFSVWILLILVVLLKNTLVLLLTKGLATSLTYWSVLLLGSLFGLLLFVLNVYFYAIIAMVIFSWLMLLNLGRSPAFHQIAHLIFQLVEPIMRPARRVLPPISGIDLSPILVLICIGVLKSLCQAALEGLAPSMLTLF